MNNKPYDVVTLTFHQSENYGALLQAYALQTTIQKLGYKTCILNYHSDGISYWSRKIHLMKDGISLSNIKSVIWQQLQRKKTYHFNQFRNKLTLSEPFDSNNMNQANELSNCFIVGSDQVWNCDCTFGDYHYFLDFVKDDLLKISYGASFGYSEIPKKHEKICKILLSDFSQISVREKQGAELIYHLLKKDAKVVLDPVLLLNTDQWKTLLKKVNKKYVFVYQAEKSAELIKAAQKIAKIKKCPVFIVSNVLRGTFGKNRKNLSNIGPDLFLSYLYSAEAVVTNSFHGTILSILFNKEFYVEPLKRNNTNSRIFHILEEFQLKERILPLNQKVLDSRIDYAKINEQLNQYREDSIAFLDAAIKQKSDNKL